MWSHKTFHPFLVLAMTDILNLQVPEILKLCFVYVGLLCVKHHGRESLVIIFLVFLQFLRSFSFLAITRLVFHPLLIIRIFCLVLLLIGLRKLIHTHISLVHPGLFPARSILSILLCNLAFVNFVAKRLPLVKHLFSENYKPCFIFMCYFVMKVLQVLLKGAIHGQHLLFTNLQLYSVFWYFDLEDVCCIDIVMIIKPLWQIFIYNGFQVHSLVSSMFSNLDLRDSRYAGFLSGVSRFFISLVCWYKRFQVLFLVSSIFGYVHRPDKL